MMYHVSVFVVAIMSMFFVSVHPIFEHDRAAYKAQKGDYEKALPLLQKAVVDHPHDPTVVYDAGVAAYKNKDSDQAYAYFSSVTQLPHVPQSLQEQAHYNRAIIHADRKEYDKGIEQCDRILQINPEHQKAKELKKALAHKKQQQQQEESKDHSKKSDQKEDQQHTEKNGQKNGYDKKEQQQQQPQQAENKNEQSERGQKMEHAQHHTKKQNTQGQESTGQQAEKNIAEKSEKNKIGNAPMSQASTKNNQKPHLEYMLERVLEEQEKASQASLKKMLKAASCQKRVGPDDRNNW